MDRLDKGDMKEGCLTARAGELALEDMLFFSGGHGLIGGMYLLQLLDDVGKVFFVNGIDLVGGNAQLGRGRQLEVWCQTYAIVEGMGGGFLPGERIEVMLGEHGHAQHGDLIAFQAIKKFLLGDLLDGLVEELVAVILLYLTVGSVSLTEAFELYLFVLFGDRLVPAGLVVFGVEL